MFDLEGSIAEWRRQMLAAGIKSPVPLDELESHLREEIERQLKSVPDAQRAFVTAVQRIGQANVLGKEFEKVERTLMKRIMIIVLGLFGILIGPGIILPALAKHRELGVWNSDIVMPVVWGALVLLAGLAATAYGASRRKA
jgi:hypothetical protein